MSFIEVYFDHCLSLFERREKEKGSTPDFYLNIGGEFTVRIRFAGQEIFQHFVRALAHLATPPVGNPDLTVCVWDSSSAPDTIPPYPSWNEDWRVTGGTSVEIGQWRVACEVEPNLASFIDAGRNLGLFWIKDLSALPWHERIYPFRKVLHWWAMQNQLYPAHAAMVGTHDQTVLIAGNAAMPASVLSCHASELLYGGEELCLLHVRKGRTWAYSIYNSGCLDGDLLLSFGEKGVSQKDRPTRGAVYFQEVCPDRIVKKAPIAAILVAGTIERDGPLLSALPNDQAFRALLTSGKSAVEVQDFFRLYRICFGIPCYKLNCGADPDRLKQGILSVLEGSVKASG